MMAARRARGGGTVDITRDGRFRPRMPALVPGGERPRLDPFDTREEADAALAAAVSVAADVPRGGLTLRTWGTRLLDRREHDGVRAIDTDRSRWKVHIESAPFIDWPLVTIARTNIRDWLVDLLHKRATGGQGHLTAPTRRLGRSTIQSVVNLLRVVFEAAVEGELLHENPAKGVKLPRSHGRTHDPWTYLLPEEQAVLLNTIEDVGSRCLVAFSIGTGIRQGEQWNAELRDIQRDDTGAWLVVRYGSLGKATKSGKVRRIPIFGIALEALDTWLPLLAKQKNPLGLLWPTKSGARQRAGKAPRAWEKWLEAAGLVAEKRHDGRQVRWHDLRHTCASSLVAGWWGRRWSLEEVCRLLGHSSIVVTQRYAHLAESALGTAARETHLSTARPQTPRIDVKDGAQVAEIIVAPPGRLERPAFGLGRPGQTDELREVDRLRGLIVDVQERAERALAALAEGGPGAWRRVTEELVEIAKAGDAPVAAKRAG